MSSLPLFVLVCILLFLPSVGSVPVQSGKTLGVASTGLLVPLYNPPGQTWDDLAQAKRIHSSVPIIAIVNPSGGSGWQRDPTFARAVGKIQASGVVVIGYVWTNYGKRPLNETEAEIVNYRYWYGVNGIYFDQMPTAAGKEGYYSALNSYVRSLGMTLTVGNAGEGDISPSYVGTLDVIVIYENWGQPNLASLVTWHSEYDKRGFALIAYGVSSFDGAFLAKASRYVGYLYITDAGAYNTYFVLPSYLGEQLNVLQVLPPPEYSLRLNALQVGPSSRPSDGEPGSYGPDPVQITGQVRLKLNDTRLGGGNGTINVIVTYGRMYSISVESNNGSYVFEHWDDGSTGPVRIISVTHSMNVTAFFSARPSTVGSGGTAQSTQQSTSSSAATAHSGETNQTTVNSETMTTQRPDTTTTTQNSDTTTTTPKVRPDSMSTMAQEYSGIWLVLLIIPLGIIYVLRATPRGRKRDRQQDS
jgi:hypothetical protein